jgi:hypothetical protein
MLFKGFTWLMLVYARVCGQNNGPRFSESLLILCRHKPTAKKLKLLAYATAALMLQTNLIGCPSLLHVALNPKGPRPFFCKNTPNLPFLAQEAQMIFLIYFFIFNLRILP